MKAESFSAKKRSQGLFRIAAFAVVLILLFSSLPVFSSELTPTLVLENRIYYRLYPDGTASAVYSEPEIMLANIKPSVTSNKRKYTVTSVAGSSFAERDTLQSVYIPDSVESIGSGAFFGCTSLKSVTANGVAEVGTDAFCGTPFALSSEFVILGQALIKYNGNSKIVKIPDGITFIGDAFSCNADIITVIVPEGVTAVGDNAFAMAAKLKNAALPQSLEKIGDRAFFGCASLVSASICSAVGEIGKEAFLGTPYLSELSSAPGEFLTVGDGVLLRYLGSGADVVVPEGIKYISDAFAYCSDVLSVTVPESCKAVGSGAFEGCPSLCRVVFKGSTDKIGNAAFKDCRSLRGLVFSGNAPSALGSGVFKNTHPSLAVYYGDGALGFEIFEKQNIPAFCPEKVAKGN